MNDPHVLMSSLGSSSLSPKSFSLETSLTLRLSTLNAFFLPIPFKQLALS